MLDDDGAAEGLSRAIGQTERFRDLPMSVGASPHNFRGRCKHFGAVSAPCVKFARAAADCATGNVLSSGRCGSLRIAQLGMF